MLLSVNPRLLEIQPVAGFYTKDAMDFWRPNYCSVPFVDGRYSCDLYMRICEETWKQYTELSQLKFQDHSHFCYHTPVPRLVERTHRRLAKHCLGQELSAEVLNTHVGYSLVYSREIGNCYTASLYLGIVSLLENLHEDLSGRLIGLYSYGSGCSGEFFAAKVMSTYQQMLPATPLQDFLNKRERLTYAEYEQLYTATMDEQSGQLTFPQYATGNYRLTSIEQHKRIYARVIC
jgi:hydroxymethylglutaryl-CoA synthase